MTFPSDARGDQAGVVFVHDGNNSYYAVVLDRNAFTLALHKVTSGSWGSALASTSATINTSTQYYIKVFYKQRQLDAEYGLAGQAPSGSTLARLAHASHLAASSLTRCGCSPARSCISVRSACMS